MPLYTLSIIKTGEMVEAENEEEAVAQFLSDIEPDDVTVDSVEEDDEEEENDG